MHGSMALSEPARDVRTFTAQLSRLVADARMLASGPITLADLGATYDALFSGAGEEALAGEMDHLRLAIGDARTEVRASDRTAFPIAALGNATVAVDLPVAELRDFCRVAAERGMTFVFERNGPTRPGAGFGTAQGVTLNLPQAFCRSEAGTDFYQELERSIELAVKAHLQKRRLLGKFVDRETGVFGSAFGGAGCAPAFNALEYGVGFAGLNEAVRLLCGQDILESDAAVRLALRIVSYALFRVREEAARHSIRLTLQESLDMEAADRFARIDAQLYPRARGLLSECGRYLPGLHGRGAVSFEKLAVEARFHTLVPTGGALAERRSVSALDLSALLRRLNDETLATRLVVA
jgi:hypothetical protein